jgi:hypothetical protein
LITRDTGANKSAYNETMLRSVDGAASGYLAADSLKEMDELSLTAVDSIFDYFAKHTPPGLPPHSLTIKVNGVFSAIFTLIVDQ